MELNFRTLRSEEIEVRIGTINKGGVTLLLYKDARCDQAILDETVGPMGWQRHHVRDNANCIVSIYDTEKKMWVEKEDTGTESFTEKEKGLASDSFKRACFNWGIGRELYTAPNMFVPKSVLQGYSYDESSRKGSCRDQFKVSEIVYETVEGRTRISYVKIDIFLNGKKHNQIAFGNTSAAKKTEQTSTETTTAPATNNATPTPTTSEGIFDNTVLLVGNCRGKKYGDVKGTKEFASFMKWILTAAGGYDNEPQETQFAILKKMAQEGGNNHG